MLQEKTSIIYEHSAKPGALRWGSVGRLVFLLLIFYTFMLSVELIGSSVSLLGRDLLSELLVATSNPFIGLFIGLLSTAILQSSSTTTSIVVAIVASQAISLNHAIPIIMGANIGTTVTSTLVALSYLSNRRAFRKALAVATSHDFFNILTAFVLFPLEYSTGFLSKLSMEASTLLVSSGLTNLPGPFTVIHTLVRPMSETIIDLIRAYPVIGVMIGVSGLLITIKVLTNFINGWMNGSRSSLERFISGHPYKSLFSGFAFTAVIQSSSLATSFVVPMAATGKISVRQVFPFIMGINVGTTFTALLAAATRSDAAIAIALAHLFFNLLGVILFMPVPWLRDLPIRCGRWLGAATLRNRLYGFLYLILLFFAIPFLLISLS